MPGGVFELCAAYPPYESGVRLQVGSQCRRKKGHEGKHATWSSTEWGQRHGKQEWGDAKASRGRKKVTA